MASLTVLILSVIKAVDFSSQEELDNFSIRCLKLFNVEYVRER